jgi:putative endonuclease
LARVPDEAAKKGPCDERQARRNHATSAAANTSALRPLSAATVPDPHVEHAARHALSLDRDEKEYSPSSGWKYGGHYFFVAEYSPFVIAGLDPAIHTVSMQGAWLYILASKPRGTLYVGVTNNISRRLHEHKSGLSDFTARYDVKSLVYVERHATMPLAIQREKNIKHWSRAWKIALIDGLNPRWRDLSKDIHR